MPAARSDDRAAAVLSGLNRKGFQLTRRRFVEASPCVRPASWECNALDSYSSAFVKSSYSAAVKRLSTSPRLVIVILIIQPSPYGSLFTFSGSSFSEVLASVTLPATGVKISDTALTDSTDPNESLAANSSPAFGNST